MTREEWDHLDDDEKWEEFKTTLAALDAAEDQAKTLNSENDMLREENQYE